MSIPHRVINDFQILLTKCLEHVITEAEMERLEKIFDQYPEITDVYHRFISLNLTLQKSSTFPSEGHPEDEFYDLLTALAQQEKIAPPVERPPDIESIPQAPPLKQSPQPKTIKPNKTMPLLAAICLFLLLVLMTLAQVQYWYRPVDVATITDMMDTPEDPSFPLTQDTRLFTRSEPISFTQGIVKILFDTGVRIVVEGPAQFNIESNRHLTLNQGKLYAAVSESGKGFRVDTPNSSIVDLGTEFGVQIFEDLTCEVQMVTGKAEFALSRPQGSPTKKILTEGHALQVTQTGDITPVPMENATFIRDFTSSTGTFWRGEWLTVVPLPAHDTDLASDIRPDKTYTHLVDFGGNAGATINGVFFTPLDFTEEFTEIAFRDESLQLTLTRIGAKSFRFFENENHVEDADGGMQSLLSDAIYLSSQPFPDHYRLSLTGLTSGQKYSLRLYYCTDQKESERSIQLTVNGEGHEKDIRINQQAGGANYIRYDYTALSQQVDITFKTFAENRSWHLYGLSNEVMSL